MKMLMTAVIALSALAGIAESARAAGSRYQAIAVTYTVQIRFLYLPTHQYVWKNYRSYTSFDDAYLMYELLSDIHDAGMLDRAIQHDSRRWKPVGVRLIGGYLLFRPGG